MDLKLSISTLIASAYFLTLFLFKLFKSHDILSILIESSVCAFGVFVILYALLTYIYVSFDRLKRKEANDAIARIRKLEEEQLAKKNAEIKDKLSEIDKAVLEKERQKKEQEEGTYNEDDEENEDNNSSNSEKAIKFQSNEPQESSEQDIEQLKREAGTQFDSSFTANNIEI